MLDAPRTLARLLLAAMLALATLASQAAAPTKTLKPFANAAELDALFATWAAEAAKRNTARSAQAPLAMSVAPTAAAAPAVANKAESVTNTQTAGVDEGGIVKLHGRHLVVLRRGRLFTIAVDGRRLEPVAAVPAVADSVSPGGTWYDEMLIWQDTVVVIGYSYARGGTEIGLFDLSADGRITHRATHHLRSNDYFSSRNYASRLVGSTLVFYTPLHVNPMSPPAAQLPAQREWRPGATPADFRPIAPPERIYRGPDALDPSSGVALHSVTLCDLAAPRLVCRSTALLAPPGRVFYVSAESVYVWTTGGRRPNANGNAVPDSMLLRIPLDGGAPSALKTVGAPTDAFSFLEDDEAHLNVLVRAVGRGEGMWRAETSAGDVALLRVALASFGDGSAAAPAEAYRPLPQPASGALQNRFVGDFLLYGSGSGWYRGPAAADAPRQVVHAVRYARFDDTFSLPLDHAVERIEAMGGDAVVIGRNGNDLGFTSLRLARVPVAVGTYRRAQAAQGETRSHGFFYKPDAAQGGIVGLPIVGGGASAGRQLWRPSASMLYLRQSALEFTELGTLNAAPAGAQPNDRCLASCVDWYGNSRPLFFGGRVFALLGYEIVEGRLDNGRITELRRVDFTPPAVEARQ
jgi:hypothetical protein